MDRVCEWAGECPVRCHGDKPPLPVWSTRVDNPLGLIVGEAPGINEYVAGMGFVGKSGQELDMYLNRFAKIPRYRFDITNVVKCAPWKGKGIDTPNAKEIAYCVTHQLLRELGGKYKVIVAVGGVATNVLVGKTTLEKVQGIPQTTEYGVVVPVYHPAYGLRSTLHMQHIMDGFRVVGEVVRGKLVVVGDTVEVKYIEVRG